ncbi:hypothetical protein C8246_05850 [Paracidovorax avenae]|nr:hypothetical protein C8246_05850 [Paracidovorax avenae]
MKQIPGFDGYCATEDGWIVSVREAEPKVLKARESQGYLVVTLAVRRGGRKQRHRMPVHRLMLLAFRGAPACRTHQGRHLDGNSLNNRIDNLAWGTPKQNTQDAIRHGTIGPGMLAHRRLLSDEQVAEIARRVRSGERSPAVAKEYGVSAYYPSKLAKGQRWAHLSV